VEADELRAAEREAMEGAQFDRLGLKRGVWEAYRAGTARLVCKRLGPLARVVCLLPKGIAEPPWELWARIFTWFGRAADGRPWRVTWFAAPSPRRFPSVGQDLGPEHVNGGYTRPCSTHGIFIYREEEATRVLIHELLHAACLDEQGPAWSIPLREAQIETWAELILVALKSKGSAAAAKRLWTAQSHWVADTNWKARTLNNTEDITDYGWRYLCGREQMYARLGVSLPPPRAAAASVNRSLRFTTPLLEK
jgi:hypothetical protein